MTDPKPCGCPDTLQTPMTVAELRALLAEYSGDTPVWRPDEEDASVFVRPRPRRLRALYERHGWREDWSDNDPNALEGIQL